MKRTRNQRTSMSRRDRPDSVAFLDDFYGSDPTWNSLVERARVNQDVAHAIYELRTARGLTQRELADLVGTKQPVIARLEDADYTGHSLSMLSRIAAALGSRLEVQFVAPVRAGRRRRVAQGREPARPVRRVSEPPSAYDAPQPHARTGRARSKAEETGRSDRR